MKDKDTLGFIVLGLMIVGGCTLVAGLFGLIFSGIGYLWFYNSVQKSDKKARNRA